ncbi:MAG: ParB/RepB/Spo0J family partition protein [Ruminiclostridium sp.]|nr:ParB/RepB/Spo0J family partition protein [Ruminiclostridium sp.]
MAIFNTKEKKDLTVQKINVKDIFPNPNQPRRVFDETELIGLAQSIKESGVIQPITVRQIARGKYELIAGERRVRASKLVGLTEVPAIVTEYSGEESAVLAIIENIQRCDLNCFEEAEAMRTLLCRKGITQEELAARLGKSQSTVANKLRLLKLPPNVRKLIVSYGLNERQARALLRLPEDKLENAVKDIHKLGLNVSQTDKYIDEVLYPTPKKKKPIWKFKEKLLYINSINKTLDIMKKSGVPFESEKTVENGYLKYIIRIPQDSAGV